MNALIKHRRKVEDSLLKSDLDFTQSLTLMFSKDESRQGMDKRPLTQSCVIAFSGKACRWLESEAIQSAVIASLPLLKVSEMVGYDPDSGTRPSVAARLEQLLRLLQVWCSF